MDSQNFKFVDLDGVELNCYKWTVENEDEARGVVQISHGMAENVYRYDRFAKKLNEKGYIVYGHDHRGHGFTAKSLNDLGYMDDKDNFHAMVKDLNEFNSFIKKENPNLPIILFGHSMGSFLSQRYIEMHGDTIDGVILCGTNGKQKWSNNFGIPITKIQMKLFGRRKVSKILDTMSFGAFNKSVKNKRTEFDWLSRDEEEVDKYIENPFCGVTFTVSYFHDLIKGINTIHKKENLDKIPKSLPIYIIGGGADPVGENGKGIVKLYEELKGLGIKNVSYKVYDGARHELLNEINRDEVQNDIENMLYSITENIEISV